MKKYSRSNSTKLNCAVYPYVLDVELLESLAIPHVINHMTNNLQNGLN